LEDPEAARVEPERPVTQEEVEAIIAYIRMRQVEAGITQDPAR
jgi:hypothetical protein